MKFLTRHRSVIIRVSHGDIYSNSRLYKFGMVDNAKCNNCDEPLETIVHKLLTCPKAQQLWREVNLKKGLLGMNETNLTLKGILGIESDSILDFTINAEVISSLISLAGKPYCPNQLVANAIKKLYNIDGKAESLKSLIHNN